MPHLPTALLCLLGFVAWTLACVVAIAGWRTLQVLGGSTRANGFASGQPHGPEWYQRLNRAHMNCVENLPLVASVILVGAAAGRLAELALLAVIVLGARVAQTVIHVASGSARAVHLRFFAFVIQVTSLGVMVGKLIV